MGSLPSFDDLIVNKSRGKPSYETQFCSQRSRIKLINLNDKKGRQIQTHV